LLAQLCKQNSIIFRQIAFVLVVEVNQDFRIAAMKNHHLQFLQHKTLQSSSSQL
jgi:hypothetical protein